MRSKKRLLLATMLGTATLALGQVTKLNNTASAATEYLGWDGTGLNSKDLDIKNIFGSKNINFWTNNGGSTLQNMIIVGSTGRVGIGTTSPSYLLDVNGDINFSHGFKLRVDGSPILWYNSTNTNNLFVGIGAGSSTTASNNTFVGGQAGHANGAGDFDTYVGFGAAAYKTGGEYNTIIGDEAAGDVTTTLGSQNTFVGYVAGFSNTADGNTFLGSDAGFSNTTGTGNVYVGANTGIGNNGSSNTFVGSSAGNQTTGGTGNCFYGVQSGFGNGTGSYNTLSGYLTGYGNAGVNSYSNNSFFGAYSGTSCLTGSHNSGFGYQSLKSLTTGAYNVALGENSMYTVTNQSYNTAVGYSALNANATGANTAVGYQCLAANTTGTNSGFGYNALNANTTGTANNAFGYSALSSNVTGNYNSAFGYYALGINTANANTAFGYNALGANTSGLYNTAVGADALENASTVHENTAVGYQSLQSTSVGNNTAVGYQSSRFTTTGTQNVTVGYAPLYNATTASNNTAMGGNVVGSNLTTGSNNTLIGYSANVAVACSTSTNMTALGNGAVVSAANTMYLGNAALTSVNINATAMYNGSDGRFKTNVTENVKGLEFINKLRPVTYKMNTEALDDFITQGMPDSIKTMRRKGMDFGPSMAIVHSGFIAQEVEKAAQQTNFSSSIVKAPAHNADHYALNYAEIVVPLVKAVQELSKAVDSLQNQLTKLQGHSGTSNSTGVNSVDIQLGNVSADAIVLNTAVPNPFAEQTVISYNVPEKYHTAEILFYDNSGKLLRTVEIKKGKGQLNVYANDLTNGVYSYTLVVDGNVFDSKKMIKQQ